nr:MAG TPA: hypothetical protein [Caudoviricetes sp.]DAL81721.1 MAG TPA: hypothetical protein [Caudoviricetes sp.]DAY36661.1 MAG TPA: hypothetical protein [Caudoviricetes sp.]
MSEAKGSRKTGRSLSSGPPTLRPCSPSWRVEVRTTNLLRRLKCHFKISVLPHRLFLL